MVTDTRRFPVWATVFTTVGLFILFSLGTWQVQRLQWKQGILLDLKASYQNPDKLPAFRGTYLHNKTVAVRPRTYEGQSGVHIITPLKLSGGDILFINRGWMPRDNQSGYSRPSGTITVRGIRREPDPGNWFTPQNDITGDVWFNTNLGEIAAAKKIKTYRPFLLYAYKETPSAEFPVKDALIWRPPNNHLGYAIFWYSMAGILALIYYLRFVRRD